MSKPKSRYQGKPRVPRWPLLAGIAVFHVLALYGLSLLLVPEFTASIEDEVVSVLSVTVTSPDEPQTEPEPDEGASGEPGKEAVPQPISAPSPAQIVIPPEPLPPTASTGAAVQSGASEDGEGTGNTGRGEGTGSGNQGGGQGNGIAVRPSVLSGNLDPARDFPVPEGGRSARFGASVTVVFTVTPEGRATHCSVARSSADPVTTSLVCQRVIDKIRFNPARRADGTPVSSPYGYRVDFRERQAT